ncbi:MAG: CoB--CoM heterodisulfide reductase subunit B [Candidatus Freyarchaeota archaeon]|nr:CoB--CoM heterodisulfide reductase subunit B [Candidatus Jordarchaeia archaeon]MBS7268249.1 CoB--CoM heterodisulfide reductase subunit B [Candidatus Jordarchaeia archaeon]MBS7279534.1 CoB--CoM heterodisulfide reductase subunit B [Candidatus Jordarchaeia archaeon]
MSREYALFLGCTIPNRLPHLEVATRLTLKSLDVNAKDLPGFACCPDPVGFSALDRFTWIVLASRNLAVAEEQGLDILTLCSGCFESLKTANYVLKHNGEYKHKVNEALAKVGKEYKGSVEVRHLLQVLYEDVGPKKIESTVKKPLTGIKVAVHYGCHVLRPSEVVQVDDPFNPTSFEGIVKATGATPVDYERRFLCCGVGVRSVDEATTNRMIEEKLRYVRLSGADLLCVICPFCLIQYDIGQFQVNKALGTDYNIPVFYYPQLLALAQGVSADELNFKFQRIKPDAVLEKIEKL